MIFAALALAAVLFAACMPASHSKQEDSLKKANQFQLSASVDKHLDTDVPHLSRNELGGDGQKISYRPPSASPHIPSGNEQEKRQPSGQIVEYGVDWAPWISALADRWFVILRNMEKANGLTFHTPRPALVKFTCTEDGRIIDVSLKQTSGVAAYDNLQMTALMQTTPLPPFPVGTERKQITLVQGWESHRKRPGESDFQLGSFGRSFPREKIRKYVKKWN